MKVNAHLLRPARKKEDKTAEIVVQEYLHPTGYEMRETISFETKSDFFDSTKCRYSNDNGETWSDWEVLTDEKDSNRNQGENQLLVIETVTPAYNKVHNHFIRIFSNQTYIGGYQKVTDKYWNEGDSRWGRFHSFITVTDDNGASQTRLIKYEDGLDFNPDNWLEPDYINKNYGLAIGNIEIDANGDILFPMEIYTYRCCEMIGRDVTDYYPYAPYATTSVVIVRGAWNGSEYKFTISQPVIINDMLSTRGLCEPGIALLKSGRIIVVMRGGNGQMAYKTRALPSVPGFKWFSYSDDGGKTFSPVAPWCFDNGEAVYSSATFSRMFYNEDNGKHYWIGNITDHTARGNFPRYPLNIVEVDETHGMAVKDTLTNIDTRREGESERVQLSNFGILHNRKTRNLEIILTKLGQNDHTSDVSNVYESEVWKYEISFD